MKRFIFAMLVLVILSSGVALAKKPLAVVESLKTINRPTNYPSYTNDFNFFTNWLKEFADFEVITDLDVEDGALKNYEAVILPDNGVMGEEEVDAYFDFVDRGGKLFGCYSTSLRKEDGSITPYQLADIFGVTWGVWNNAKDKHNYILFESHKIFKGLGEGLDNISNSTQIVNLTNGEVLASWTNADKTTPSEPDEKNACIVENEGSIFISFPINNSLYLNHENFSQLFKNIIAYIAPNAIK